MPLLGHPALAQQQHAQCVQAALEHQRAWHHAVIDKVAGEKPVVRMNVRLSTHQPQTKAPACRIKVRDAMHQLHAAIGQCDRMAQRQMRERVTKTRGQITRTQGVKLCRRITFHFDGREHVPIRSTLARPRFQIE